MQDEALRAAIARRIAFYRRQAGHTQADLAEKLSYSDKSISKWERGEGVPDIYVLTRIAELYGVTVNDLISEDAPRPAKNPPYLLVTLLSLGLVWLVAAVAFFVLKLLVPEAPKLWLGFIYALPVCSILLIVFSALWRGWIARGLSISLLVWTLAASIHLTVSRPHIQLVYIVAGFLQLLCLLWVLLCLRKGKS